MAIAMVSSWIEKVNVLFITGMTKRFSKLSTGTALKNSSLLKEQYNNKVFIACRNVLVAGEGLESLYRKIRDEGVIIFHRKLLRNF